MWVRSIVKGSIPRTGDDIRLSDRALDRDRRLALKRLPEQALQYPAGGFPGLRLEPNVRLEAIPAVRYAASHCRSSPGQAPSGFTFVCGFPWNSPSTRLATIKLPGATAAELHCTHDRTNKGLFSLCAIPAPFVHESQNSGNAAPVLNDFSCRSAFPG